MLSNHQILKTSKKFISEHESNTHSSGVKWDPLSTYHADSSCMDGLSTVSSDLFDPSLAHVIDALYLRIMSKEYERLLVVLILG